MSFIQRLIEALDARLWKFIRIVHSSNHDYPYHDYIEIDNSQGADPLTGYYAVGTSNVNAHGDQSKRFVSKHANIYSSGNVELRFNDSRNVMIHMPFHGWFNGVEAIGAFEKTFLTNIAAVHYTIPANSILLMYFEGVLPEEARDAE